VPKRPSFRPRSDLWRDPGFVRLFAANAVSQLGSAVSVLALPLTALFVLKSSALGVALLRAFAVLPFVFFSLPAGVWIDRMRRRPLMIVADFGRAAAMASIPIAYWLGHVTLWQLYVVAAAHGVLQVLFDVSYLSFLPGLVSRERLGEANAKLLGAQSLAQLAGPSLAGALIGAVGAAVAVLADAISFVLSGAFVASIRGREPRPEPSTARKRDELVEGLRYVFSQPYLRTLTVWTSIWNLFTSSVFALFIVYYVRVLHWGPTKIGLLTALGTSGFVVGALVNGRVVQRVGVGRVIAYSGMLSSLTLVLIPAAPIAHAAPIIVASGLVGTTLGFFANVNQLTLRQSITPPRLLGRMNSVVRFMYWGTIPAGSALGGVLAGQIGLRETLLFSALGATVACIPIALSPIRKLRTLPEAAPEPALSVEPLLPDLA
jgi:predicted MFS family arabinose efflux permease